MPETKPQVPEAVLEPVLKPVQEPPPPSFSSALEFAKWGMKNYPQSSSEFTNWAMEKQVRDRDKRRKITYARYLLTFARKNVDWDARTLVNRFREIKKKKRKRLREPHKGLCNALRSCDTKISL